MNWNASQFRTYNGLRKIDRLIRSIPVDRALEQCCIVSTELRTSNKVIDELDGFHASQWALAYLARAALVQCNSARVSRERAATVLELCNLYNEYAASLSTQESRSEQERNTMAFSILTKLTYEQFGWQVINRNAFARTREMFFRPISDAGEISSNRIIKLFHQVFDMEYDDMLFLAYAAMMLFEKNRVVIPQRLLHGEKKHRRFEEALSKSNVEKFFRHFSTSPNDFKTRQRSIDSPLDSPRPPFERPYLLNALRTFPIIRSENDGLYRAPVPILLAERVTSTLYYDLVKETSISNSYPGGTGQFFKDYGQLFEDYCGVVLSDDTSRYRLGVNLFPIDDYLDRGGLLRRAEREDWRKPDWIVCDEESTVLIECKSSRPKLAITDSGDADGFRKLIRERYLSVDEKQKKLQFEDIYGALQAQGVVVYCVIVVNDCFPFYNNLEGILSDKVILSRCRNLPLHFLSIYELEQIAAVSKKVSLSDILRKKLQPENEYGWHFGPTIHHLWGDEPIPRLNLFDKAAAEVFAYQAT